MHHLEATVQDVHTISKCDFEHLRTRVAFIETHVRKGSLLSQRKWLPTSRKGTWCGGVVPQSNKFYLRKGLILTTLVVNSFFARLNNFQIVEKQ